MAARSFKCQVMNMGQGNITYVKDHLDTGTWTDGIVPHQEKNTIEPGAVMTFGSESDGILKGTTGSVTFQTIASDVTAGKHTEFLKISWDIPYFKFTATPADGDVTIEKARFDPDADRNSFEWNERDTSTADIAFSTLFSGIDGSLLDLIKNSPDFFLNALANPVTAFTGGVLTLDHVYCYITVTGSVSDAPPVYTFPSGAVVMPVVKPLDGSTIAEWVGEWVGQDVSVSLQANGDTLNATVTETDLAGKQHTFSDTALMIDRHRSFSDAEHRHALPPGLLTATPMPVTRLAGSLKESLGELRKTTDPALTAPVTADTLHVAADVTIDIYRLVQGPKMVGQTLRYRRTPNKETTAINLHDTYLSRQVHLA